MLILGFFLRSSPHLCSGLQELALRAGFPLGSVKRKHCWGAGGGQGRGEARVFFPLLSAPAASLPGSSPCRKGFLCF